MNNIEELFVKEYEALKSKVDELQKVVDKLVDMRDDLLEQVDELCDTLDAIDTMIEREESDGVKRFYLSASERWNKNNFAKLVDLIGFELGEEAENGEGN